MDTLGFEALNLFQVVMLSGSDPRSQAVQTETTENREYISVPYESAGH